MSNYNSLKTTIDANIKQNGNQEITGQILNSVLNAMVTTLGAGYQFAGVATIDTNPGTPDAKVFYIANGKGTYEKFGGINVTEDDVVILYWDSSWHKVSTGIASNEKLSELATETGVYKKVPVNVSDGIFAIYDASIKNRQSNYYYWLQINKTDSLQQLAFFRTDAVHISEYTEFVNLVYKESDMDSGIQLYSGVLSSGESITILINWDKVSGSNSLNADKYEFQDWVFTGGHIKSFLPLSLSIDDMPFDAAGIAKSVQKTDGIANNLVSFQDFHTPGSFWASGSIEKIQNLLKANIVKFNSVGADASWQGYITAFIKLKDLEERSGLDFRNNTQFLDFSFGSPVGSVVWIVLRYEQDDNYAFYTYGDVDAVFNKSGGHQGFNEDDTTTWVDASFNTDSTDIYEIFSVKNLKIPYTYKGKNLYAVMICVGGDDGEKTIDNLTCVVHGGNYVSIPFFYDKYGDTIKDLQQRVGQIESGVELPIEKYYAACGDSITNANHPTIYDIDENDPYIPIDGYSSVSTYKRKCYAYYIAKKFRLKWANYGWGGSTLHHCAPKGYAGQEDFNPFVDSRIENLKQGINWDYISIFFGWNDCAYGPIYQRDLWLQETYGTNIGYPVTSSQVGTTGFATAEQKAACDTATGSVGGIQYDDNNEYFFARFIGTISDNTKNTWMGAWNYALEYLMKKYPTAKIMIVAPYVTQQNSLKIRNSVKEIAEKWGVVCFDFEDLPYWYYQTIKNTTHLANPDSADGRWYTKDGTPCEPYVSGYNEARYSYDTLHPSNLGYETMANPFGDKLING